MWSSRVQTCRRAQVIDIQLHQASRRRVRTHERNQTISWLGSPPTSGLGSFAILVFGLGSGVQKMKTLLIRKPSASKTNQPSCQQAVQSSLTWDSRRLSRGLPWWGCTTFVFACIDPLFSCQMLLSNGPNSRDAHLFAIFGFSNSCARICNL